MKTTARLSGLASIAAPILIALSLNAASYAQNVVSWGPATNITKSSDVILTGTLVGAFNIGGPGVPSTTVNTVTFSPFAIADGSQPDTTVVGNFSYFYGTSDSDNTAFGSSNAPFSSLAASDPSYATLLQSGVRDFANSTGLQIKGLTIGDTYYFQWWVNVSSFGPAGNITVSDSNFKFSVVLDPNTSNVDGGLGQFAIGTFTATSTSQTFIFTGPGELNAFQLRTVPEPSTWGILSLGFAMLMGRRKRHHHGR